MKELSPTQKKFILGFGIIVLLEAIVMFVLIFAGKVDLPLMIPIPLTVSAVCLLFLGLRK